MLAATSHSWRVRETAKPPTYYLDESAFLPDTLQRCSGESWCEWKGRASYFDLVVGAVRSHHAAWCYLKPTPGFGDLAGLVAIYPGRVDRCTLDGEEVRTQEGEFYGGWITSRLTGPFKGGPGTLGW